MRPRTTREYREVSPQFYATCTAGSMMYGLSRLVTPLTDDEEVPPLVASVAPMEPLVRAAMLDGEVLTLDILLEHFSSLAHYQAILKDGTIVGNEISVNPKCLRPVLHTLLPLDSDGCYRNVGFEIELRNLLEFDEAEGVGFWAAHLAGKIWIPRSEEYRQELLARQAKSAEFVRSIAEIASTCPIVDYAKYPRLISQTRDAKEKI